jgi:hypothetical protein
MQAAHRLELHDGRIFLPPQGELHNLVRNRLPLALLDEGNRRSVGDNYMTERAVEYRKTRCQSGQ